MCIADCLSDFFFIYDIRLRLIRCLTNQLNLAHIIQQANQQHRILRHLLFGIGEFVPVCLAVDHDQIAQFNKMAVINTAYCKQGFLKSVLCTVQLRQIGADLIDLAFGLRRFTKGYYIKQPNMDCQPTEFTALSRHRAVFSWAGKGGIPIIGA